MSRVVVDTGVLFAAADRRDRDHQVCVELLDVRSTEELVLPAPVAVETAWLIGNRLGPGVEAAFVASVVVRRGWNPGSESGGRSLVGDVASVCSSLGLMFGGVAGWVHVVGIGAMGSWDWRG